MSETEAATDEQTKPAPRWPNPPEIKEAVVPLERQFKAPKREAFYRILRGELQSAETAHNCWTAKPQASVTREHMLRPAFWAHVAKSLCVGDRIEVLSGDASWFLELIVRACDGIEVVMGELRYVAFDAIAQRNPDEYEIAYKGPTVKFRITRKLDNVVVKEGLQSKLAAEAWLASPLVDKAA